MNLITLGPYHPSWSGPFLLKIDLDGEYIQSTSIEIGFSYKSLEKRLIGKKIEFCNPYLDRLDAENAIFCERLFCETIEQILDINPSERAESIRSIFCELTRISSHLKCLSHVAQSVGFETASHFFLRERELILEMFELITGARFALNFLKIGGVSCDITDGFLEKVSEFVSVLRLRLREYNDIITYNYAFIGRMAGVGVISRELALSYGLTGANLRASGVAVDMRDREYENLCPFKISVGTGELGEMGDCFDRFIIRLREISSSLDILNYLIKKTEKGPLGVPYDVKKRKRGGSYYHHLETPRGLMGCYLNLNDSGTIEDIHFRTPSIFTLNLFSKLLVGQRIQDIETIYSSLDIALSEVDK